MIRLKRLRLTISGVLLTTALVALSLAGSTQPSAAQAVPTHASEVSIFFSTPGTGRLTTTKPGPTGTKRVTFPAKTLVPISTPGVVPTAALTSTSSKLRCRHRRGRH